MTRIDNILSQQLEQIANETINTNFNNLIQQHLKQQRCGCIKDKGGIQKCDIGLWVDSEITGVEFMNKRVENSNQKVAG